ncbi:thiol reductant ABC exporter subunit CydD [Bacillus sp. FJAT-49732]|uniref:Thiol reductant ABC exporter subunit CydD n=1 Tax=Lederbergia citrisecunda TaxID=2833583 RepID=A0A942TJR6_9BACI|nr:thiol reductant ABC exporter subunit CydD [Lederbergia citrisecunda]MBS4198388.1 thiol reductant ABC exporter subunit CydD [Lederbergia citrisecunda]
MDRNLLHYKGSKSLIVIVGILTVAQTLAIIFQAVYLSEAIVKMYKGAALSAVLPSFFIFFGAYAARHFLQWMKDKLAYRFADKTSIHFQQLLVDKLFDLGPREIGKKGSGDLITLCLEGIPNFRTYLKLFIPRFVATICIPIMLLIYVLKVDIASGIILAVVMPIMIIFLILLGLTAKKQIEAQLDTYQLLSRHFVDSLRGLVTLKYLGKSKSHQEAIKSVSNKYRIATNRTLRVAFLSTFSLDFFSSLSVAVVAVELGLRLINGGIGLESALTILILAPEYFLPVRELGNDYHATMDGKEAGEKIHSLLKKEGPSNQYQNVTIKKWDENSTLSIRNLTKSSEEENRVILNNINFEISGFAKVGIVGTSGAGKSTLIDILSGFTQPSIGNIHVNGTTLHHFSNSEWQEQVTYIPQHPYIFSGTLAENIGLYAKNPSQEEIERAVQMAGISELVKSLPKGLEEKVGQGGRILSGGEEQRVALARALLEKRPIMLFDEPTAHLDIETEHEIKNIILPMLDNKLVFFATHRLHWMKNMDIILILENGELVEYGSHDELIRRNGEYFRLVSALGGGGMK